MRAMRFIHHAVHYDEYQFVAKYISPTVLYV